MDLKSIRATVHPTIWLRFKELDRVLSIVEPLEVSGNTGLWRMPPRLPPSDRGLCSEFFAAVEALRETPAAFLLQHRLRTPFAELDLIIRDANALRIVEVKSLGTYGLLEGRIPLRQRQRLFAARSWVEASSRQLTRLDLALVGPQGEVTWIDDFLS